MLVWQRPACDQDSSFVMGRESPRGDLCRKGGVRGQGRFRVRQHSCHLSHCHI